MKKIPLYYLIFDSYELEKRREHRINTVFLPLFIILEMLYGIVRLKFF